MSWWDWAVGAFGVFVAAVWCVGIYAVALGAREWLRRHRSRPRTLTELLSRALADDFDAAAVQAVALLDQPPTDHTQSPAGVLPSPLSEVDYCSVDTFGLTGTGNRIPINLYYVAADPYTVLITFVDQDNDWVISRDLLLEGQHRPTGLGDVQFTPSGSGRGLYLRLHTPDDGEAVLRMPMDDIRAFLAAVYQLVPSGTESEHLDVEWDTELAQLLNSP